MNVKFKWSSLPSSFYLTDVATAGPIDGHLVKYDYNWCGGGHPCSGWSTSTNYSSYSGAGPSYTVTGTWDGAFKLFAGWLWKGTTATPSVTIEIDGKDVYTSVFSTTNSGFGVWVNKIPFRVGDPDGTPTYLETLDKLDQWSSAHYIPKSRDKLNL